MAHSPYTKQAVAFVERNEACTKMDLAVHLTRSYRRCPSKQYYLVNTQIRLGNIIAELHGNRYRLYTRKQYEQLEQIRHDAAIDGVTL